MQSARCEESWPRGVKLRHVASPLVARTALLLVLAWLILVSAEAAQNPKDLKAQGYVNDFARVLNEDTRGKLTALCAEVEQKAQAQIAVVTVKSLGGRPIEEYSIDLATHLGVGPKKSDRGVMILLATDDRQYRFEVGYGLEGILPDGKVGGFGRDALPALWQGDYDGAALLMTRRVAATIAEDRGVSLANEPEVPASDTEQSKGPDVIERTLLTAFAVLFVFRLLLLFFSTRRRRFGGGGWWIGPMMGGWGGGGFGGGGWVGGGGSSGGFGGFGGGSFGGGGASGRW